MGNVTVKVKSPFRMGDNDYKPGDKLSVTKEKAADLVIQGLISKGVEAPPKDKRYKGGKKK